MTDNTDINIDIAVDNQYTTDSKALAQLLNAMANLGGNSHFLTGSIVTLSDVEYNNMFRKSNLIRKIISMLPYEASNAGYTVKKSSGEVLSEKNILIANAFCEAAIHARLYGKSYLVLQTSQDDDKPLKPNDIVISNIIYRSLELSGDFYIDKQGDKISHVTKTFLFFGNRSFIGCDVDNKNYADSILMGLISTLNDFLSSTKYSTKILQNLSNLTIGMKNLGMKLRSTTGKQEINDRLTSFDMNRAIDTSIAYDLDNENVDYITQTLSGIPDILSEMKNLFIASTEYTSDKLFPSQQSSGISSGLQNQLIVRFEWATQVKEWAESNYLENLYKLYKTISNIDITISIPLPLELTDMEKMELEVDASNRNKNLIELQIITAKEARKAYERESFSIDIVLDNEAPKVDIGKSISNDSKVSLLNTDIEKVNDDLWLALSRITMKDIDRIALEVIEVDK